jgi:hypothetical protein
LLIVFKLLCSSFIKRLMDSRNANRNTLSPTLGSDRYTQI